LRNHTEPSQWRALLAATLALLAIVASLSHLERAASGLDIEALHIGSTPVTVFRQSAGSGLAADDRSPVALIAHGFAGSQQLMQPLAMTLAHGGYTAITFDFPGHGRNVAPMRGGLADTDASLRTLLASMDQMGRYAAQLAGSRGRYAVVGHSMASDIVVRHAQAHPEVEATVAISLFAPSINAQTPADSPRNLLVIDGALEPGVMAAEALRVLAPGQVTGGVTATSFATTYGDFRQGTARRALLSPGVEHIGVLYSAATLAATLEWLNQTFDRSSMGTVFIDERGLWLGLLVGGLVLLAWPLSFGLSRLALGPNSTPRPMHDAGSDPRWLGWRGVLTLVVVPAVLTPLILWPLPTNFLPILLGDYLMMHFALYGLLTGIGLLLAGRLHRPPAQGPGRTRLLVRRLTASLLTTAYALLALGLPLDRYAFNMWPELARWPLVLCLLAGTLPWCLADEWLTRAGGAPRGAYLASKIAFLGSLVIAIALDPQRLFFLVIIVPLILMLFVIHGLYSRWIAHRTNEPVIAAVANAVVFAWSIAVTFPLVS
jgi:dienelactone hydrolase